MNIKVKCYETYGKSTLKMIRSVKASDAPAICAIYNYYIENTLVTFEEDSLEASAILQRINSHYKISLAGIRA